MDLPVSRHLKWDNPAWNAGGASLILAIECARFPAILVRMLAGVGDPGDGFRGYHTMRTTKVDAVHKKLPFLSLVLLLLLSSGGFSEIITISGSVKDKRSFAPIDSARIEIVNTKNPAERYSVVTNVAGLWSYSFNMSGVLENPGIPGSFSVDQNYPNPFNPSTTIPLSIQTAGDVRITVYNAVGQLMDAKTFSVPAGNHAINWTSKGAAGMLFYSVEFGGARTTRKMVQLDGGGHGGLGVKLPHLAVVRRSQICGRWRRIRTTLSLRSLSTCRTR
jgi:hypothetical protein